MFRRKTKRGKPPTGLTRQDTKPGLLKRMMSFKAPSAPEEVSTGTPKTKKGQKKRTMDTGPTPSLEIGSATDLGFHHEANEDTANIMPDLFKDYDPGDVEYQGTEPRTVSFFSVFDGHGGTGASYWARDKLHQYLRGSLWKGNFHDLIGQAMTFSFLKNEEQFTKYAKEANDMAGSCATCVVLKGNKLYCANAGDSKAMVFSPAPKKSKKATGVVELNERHGTELKSERKRILKAGGEIAPDGSVFGVLFPTRGFGDIDVKAINKPVVIANPNGIGCDSDPHVLDITKVSYLILASDGLWDFASDEEVMDIILQMTERRKSLDVICQELIGKARMGCSEDDITITLVKITFKG